MHVLITEKEFHSTRFRATLTQLEGFLARFYPKYDFQFCLSGIPAHGYKLVAKTNDVSVELSEE